MDLTQPTIPSWINETLKTAIPHTVSLSNNSTGTGIKNLYASIFNFSGKIAGFDYPGLISTGKKVAIAFIIFFGIIVVYFFTKIRKLNKSMLEISFQKQNPAADVGINPQENVLLKKGRWDEIKSKAQSFSEADWKIAVIEADKYTDDALKNAGYLGETMGERLTLIKPGDLINLQQLWDAHKLRNLLVHDVNFFIKHSQAIAAVDVYEKVLKEIRALN